MSVYLLVKYLHIVCAVISIAGFVVRGALRLQDSAILQKKLVRILPHVVDTLLLLSAIFLIVQRSEYPFISGWLTAKTLGLFVYIGFGLATLRFAKTRSGGGLVLGLVVWVILRFRRFLAQLNRQVGCSLGGRDAVPLSGTRNSIHPCIGSRVVIHDDTRSRKAVRHPAPSSPVLNSSFKKH